MPQASGRRTVRPMTNTTNMTNANPTTSDPKIESVQRLYAAYGRSDIDGVLAELADDVDWAAEASGTTAPWWGPFNGKSDVPTIKLDVVPVTKDKVKDTVIADGFWKASDVCTGAYKSACADAGIQ